MIDYIRGIMLYLWWMNYIYSEWEINELENF